MNTAPVAGCRCCLPLFCHFFSTQILGPSAGSDESDDDDYDYVGGHQGCIFRLTCSHPELTEDQVLTSVYVKNFITVTRNAVNKSV